MPFTFLGESLQPDKESKLLIKNITMKTYVDEVIPEIRFGPAKAIYFAKSAYDQKNDFSINVGDVQYRVTYSELQNFFGALQEQDEIKESLPTLEQSPEPAETITEEEVEIGEEEETEAKEPETPRVAKSRKASNRKTK